MTTTTVPQGGSSIRGGTTLRRAAPALGAVPFFVYTILFLLIPTGIVAIQAFRSKSGSFSLENIRAIGSSEIIQSIVRSLWLSLISSIIGAVLGGIVAYFLSTALSTSLMRKLVTSASSVLAQFGGVMLAFAFTFTFLNKGLVGRGLTSLGIPLDPNFFSTLPGLIIVYTYFQLPLMVIIFLPAVDGIRPQWREATESLGGSTWVYWRSVVGPLLTPSFLGSFLLLFTNALSSYATALALTNLGGPLITLQIRKAMVSETGLGAPNLAKAEALVIVLIVAVVMALYYWIQRRAARWLT